MVAALALTAALASPLPCAQVEVLATGRSAHGSAVMPAAAPHLLIKALDRLPAWATATAAVSDAQIERLEAATAVNIIPARATAVLEIRFDQQKVSPAGLVASLSEALGGKVEVSLLPEACEPGV